MDRAIPFVRNAVKDKKSFFAVIWFHTPHLPVVAGPKYRQMYAHLKNESLHDYYGCITAMDDQIGRLQQALNRLGVADNTILFFCSDNGPEGPSGSAPGSAGLFRGRKRSLLEGGIRVPAFMVWPSTFKPDTVANVPLCTSDYLPTVVSLLKLKMPKNRPIDGVNMLPLIINPEAKRPRPIGFQSGKQLAWNDNRYVLYSKNRGKDWELYDIIADPSQGRDVSAKHPDVVRSMSAALRKWQQSCQRSLQGEDYKSPSGGKQ